MIDKHCTKRYAFDCSRKYRIYVYGTLDESLSECLGGMCIITGKDDRGPIATLTGTLQDQAELSGVLNNLYGMHLTLLSVELLDPE